MRIINKEESHQLVEALKNIALAYNTIDSLYERILSERYVPLSSERDDITMDRLNESIRYIKTVVSNIYTILVLPEDFDSMSNEV